MFTLPSLPEMAYNLPLLITVNIRQAIVSKLNATDYSERFALCWLSHESDFFPLNADICRMHNSDLARHPADRYRHCDYAAADYSEFFPLIFLCLLLFPLICHCNDALLTLKRLTHYSERCADYSECFRF